ncbi:MAG TPA: zinc metalloprotease HtpX [Kofleriaceae bacterium]|nr:zinc metalloprotease HtpX [Kofleriaceae bacterium]
MNHTRTFAVNQLKTIGLLGVLSAILVAIGAAVSPGAMWVFGAIAVLMNLAAYFWSDRLVLAMSRARPLEPGADPVLEGMVRELAARADTPMPRIFVIDEDAPNAFATGRNPEHAVVAVTTGIRRMLTERELRGVIAHELAHIRNRDILVASVAAMIASVIAMIASVIKWGAIFGFGGSDRDEEGGGAGSFVGALVLAIVAPIAATIVQLAISRSREYGADATGAQLSGDPLALASALAKLQRGNERLRFHTVGDNPATASLFIVAPLTGADVASWFSTHPPIAERIRRLQAMVSRPPRAARAA